MATKNRKNRKKDRRFSVPKIDMYVRKDWNNEIRQDHLMFLSQKKSKRQINTVPEISAKKKRVEIAMTKA